MTMVEYIQERIDLLQAFCDKEGLSIEKILKSPKCYNNEFMVIQYWDKNSENSKLGLADNTPSKVLLTITRNGDNLSFEPSDDIKDYLA